MVKRGWVIVALLLVSLSWPERAFSQTASPDTLAAAKELMTVSKMTDQLKLMLPAVIQQVKRVIVAVNPRVEKDFDSLSPVMQAAMETRLQAFVDEGAKIYAR